MMQTIYALLRPLGSVLAALVLATSLSACAVSKTPKDPLENFNRAMFSFNDKLDQVALKPAATFYQRVTPNLIQAGIGNFFGNLGDVWTAINNLLQGKGADGMSDVMRVALNSTLGIGGIFDIASEAGMAKHNEDFGQTLGTWGVKSGPYVVLPFFGSFTLRDAAVLPIDLSADPWSYKRPVDARNVGMGVRLIDQRAAVLDASRMIEEAALDKYEFVRDAYLQRRESRINDGRGSERQSDKVQAEPPQGEAAVDQGAKPQGESAKPQEDSTKPQDDKAKPQDDKAKPQDDKAKPQDDKAKPQDGSAKPEVPAPAAELKPATEAAK